MKFRIRFLTIIFACSFFILVSSCSSTVVVKDCKQIASTNYFECESEE